MVRVFSKKIAGLLLLVFVLFPTLVSARTTDLSSLSERQQYLIERIEELTNEVLRLQVLLLEKKSQLDIATVDDSVEYELVVGKQTDHEPYESHFFDLDFEEIYFLDDGDLVNTDNTGKVRLIDKQIYDLFVSVIGNKEVEDSVGEWRIFEDRSTDIGAFVELMPETGDWIVAVNRFEFDIRNEAITISFADLLVHEYAHILLSDEFEFRKRFTNNFWTRADFRHRQRVENAREDDRFQIKRRYYENNRDRFVTEYATTNEDEDMAETFVEFVLKDRPEGDGLEDEKVRFFYQNATFIKERAKIRSNLKKIDLL